MRQSGSSSGQMQSPEKPGTLSRANLGHFTLPLLPVCSPQMPQYYVTFSGRIIVTTRIGGQQHAHSSKAYGHQDAIYTGHLKGELRASGRSNWTTRRSAPPFEAHLRQKQFQPTTRSLVEAVESPTRLVTHDTRRDKQTRLLLIWTPAVSTPVGKANGIISRRCRTPPNNSTCVRSQVVQRQSNELAAHAPMSLE